MKLKIGTRILAFGLVIVAVFAATSDSILRSDASLSSEARSAQPLFTSNPIPFLEFDLTGIEVLNNDALLNPTGEVGIEDHTLQNTNSNLGDLRSIIEAAAAQEQSPVLAQAAPEQNYEVLSEDELEEVIATHSVAPLTADPQRRTQKVYTNSVYDTIQIPMAAAPSGQPNTAPFVTRTEVRPPLLPQQSSEVRSAGTSTRTTPTPVRAVAPRAQQDSRAREQQRQAAARREQQARQRRAQALEQQRRQAQEELRRSQQQQRAQQADRITRADLRPVWSESMMARLRREALAESHQCRLVADSYYRIRCGNRSKGKCRQAVSEILYDVGITRSKINTGRNVSAYLTGGWLERQRRNGRPAFRNIVNEVRRDPNRAPIGSILVYSGGRYGHVEIKTNQRQYCSDFCSSSPITASLRRTLIGVYVPTQAGRL